MQTLLSKRWLRRTISALVLGPAALWMIYYGGLPFLVFVFFCAAISFYEWFRLSQKTRHVAFFVLAGVLYVGISYWACYQLRMDHSVKIALLFMTMVWASDIGAYMTGKTFGGPKMTPNISPNKTWSGYAGALVFPAFGAAIYLVAYDFLFRNREIYDFSALIFTELLIIGAVIGIVGQSGDLLISLFKRHVGVKDTGNLIPGHGGLLDRVDAMMLCAPVFLFIVSEFPDVFKG